ncbi:hypothetical protein PENTCL1PPCAC_17335, partial [Pristionchus entomophagus]
VAMLMWIMMGILPWAFKWISVLFSLIPHYAIAFILDAKREGELRDIYLMFSEIKWIFPQGIFILMLVF